jgi:hypothetical protein
MLSSHEIAKEIKNVRALALGSSLVFHITFYFILILILDSNDPQMNNFELPFVLLKLILMQGIHKSRFYEPRPTPRTDKIFISS